MGLGTRFGGTALPEVAAGPVLWEINVRPAGCCCCWHPVVCVCDVCVQPYQYDEIQSDDLALYCTCGLRTPRIEPLRGCGGLVSLRLLPL
jgi:hypothetical protein